MKKLVDQFHAKIILISSWRSYFRKINDRISPTNHALGQELIKRLSDYQLQIDDLVEERESIDTSRGVEIVNYIDRFNIERYVIIDDELHDFKELQLVNHVQTLSGNYVEDKPEDQGFNEQVLYRAIQLLKNER